MKLEDYLTWNRRKATSNNRNGNWQKNFSKRWEKRDDKR